MKPIKIPIHSFVDLITNSSTEIFVQATDKTIKTAKDIVNDLLTFNGSTQTADELFTFSLIMEGAEYTDEETEEDICVDRLDITSKEGEKIYKEHFQDSEYQRDIILVVTPKIDSPLIKTIAKSLEKLHSTYEQDASYN